MSATKPTSLGRDVYRSVLRAFRRLENAALGRFTGPHERNESVLRELNPVYNRFLINRVKKSVDSVENLKTLRGSRWGSIYGFHGKESLRCELHTANSEAVVEEEDKTRDIPGFGQETEADNGGSEEVLQWIKNEPGDSHVPADEVSIALSLTENADSDTSKLKGRVREAEVWFKNPDWKDWTIIFNDDHTFKIEIAKERKPKDAGAKSASWTFVREPSTPRQVYDAVRHVALEASEEDLEKSFHVLKLIHFRAEQLEQIAVQEKENYQKSQEMLDGLKAAKDGQEAAGLIKALSELWLHPADQGLQYLFQAGSAALGRRIWVDALRHFNEAIERDPTVAEAWNRRAVCNFEANRLDSSLWDIEQVLKREPRHFGAISGKANVYKFKREPEKELEALRELLAIIPSDQTAKNRIEAIEAELSGAAKTILDAEAEEVIATVDETTDTSTVEGEQKETAKAEAEAPK